MSMGVAAIVHSEDGPAQYYADGNPVTGHVIVSSSHFEPMEWQLSICKK